MCRNHGRAFSICAILYPVVWEGKVCVDAIYLQRNTVLKFSRLLKRLRSVRAEAYRLAAFLLFYVPVPVLST